MRDAQWATWTCTLGWPVQGIWPAEADGTDVNAVDRSSDQSTLVTADDFGRVNLFRYPCVSPLDAHRSYVGHSSHVTNTTFTFGGRYVITTGGNDKCVFQWRHEVEQEEDEDAVVLNDDYLDGADNADLQSAGAGGAGGGGAHSHKSGRQAVLQEAVNANLGEDEMAELFAATGGGDEFMAVKPWIGAIKEPSDYSAPSGVDEAAPAGADLELQWVHGYSSQSRSTVRYSADGQVTIQYVHFSI